MPNKRRRAKKAMKKLNGQSFQDGGNIFTGQDAHGTLPGFGNIGDIFDSVLTGIVDLGTQQALNNLDPQLAGFLQGLADFNRAASGSGAPPLDPRDYLNFLQDLQPSGGGGGGGGGGTSFSVSDFGPVRAGLDRLQQDLTLRLAQMQDTRTNLQQQLDAADDAAKNAISQQLADNQTTLTMLTQLQNQATNQIQIRGQDISLFGIQVQQQSIEQTAEQDRINSEIEIWQTQLSDALARGDQQLAQEAQNQLTQLGQQQNQITGRGQDITQRGQDINAQIEQNRLLQQDLANERDFALGQGDLALRQDVERRQRAAAEQGAILEQFNAQLQSAQFGQTGQQGAANVFSNLARDRGNIELQRDQFLSQLLANPRDAPQLQIALGGGESFFDQLLGGQGVGGQSLGNIGTTPLLGDLFLQTLQGINERPDIALFDEAAGFARQLGQGQGPQAPSLDQLQSPFADLPGLTQLPQFTGQFDPTPIDAPQVDPFSPAPIDPVSVGQQFVATESDVAARFQELVASGMDTSRILNLVSSGQLARQIEDERRAAPTLPPPVGNVPSPFDETPTLPVTSAPPPLSAAGGADFVTDEPLFMVNAQGQVKATLGERTPEHPEGIPEMVEITPFAHGGTVSSGRLDMSRAAQDARGGISSKDAIARFKVNRERETGRPVFRSPDEQAALSRVGAPTPRKPPTSRGLPPGGIGVVGPPGQERTTIDRFLPPFGGRDPRIGIVGDSPFLDPRRGLPDVRDQFNDLRGMIPGTPRPPGGFGPPVNFPPGAFDDIRKTRTPFPDLVSGGPFVPTNPLDDIRRRLIGSGLGDIEAQPFRQSLPRQLGAPQILPQPAPPPIRAPQPFGARPAPQPFGAALPRARSAGETLLMLRNNLTPRGFSNLLPSQIDFLSGNVSALGVDPNDFFADLLRGFPTGINPGAISRASFSRGGRVFAIGA